MFEHPMIGKIRIIGKNMLKTLLLFIIELFFLKTSLHHQYK